MNPREKLVYLPQPYLRPTFQGKDAGKRFVYCSNTYESYILKQAPQLLESVPSFVK
jgi:hypothetical protein